MNVTRKRKPQVESGTFELLQMKRVSFENAVVRLDSLSILPFFCAFWNSCCQRIELSHLEHRDFVFGVEITSPLFTAAARFSMTLLLV